MPQFFVNNSDIRDGRCMIGGEDFRHLVIVRRVREGDIISLRSDTGKIISARILSIGNDALEAEMLRIEEGGRFPIAITLCLGLLKGKNFDLAVQKATEVGVSAIIPVITDRSVPVPKDSAGAKSARWRRIASEAAKQSLRPDIPSVYEIRLFDELVSEPYSGLKIIAHPSTDTGREYLTSQRAERAAMLLIGPEGGFSDREIGIAMEYGWTKMNFGDTQLRSETAAIIIPALLLWVWGE